MLRSWAVPKGVPLDPGARHLAVHVEDHPLDYGAFEGVIPAGQYGAGTVEIWDRGTYARVEEKRDGGLTFDLHGDRLRGRWTLVPAHLDGKPENWLLLRKDPGPDRGSWRPMLATAATTPPVGTGVAVRAEVGRLSRPGGRSRWRGVAHRPRRQRPRGARFPELARALPLVVRTPDAVVDGELCSLTAAGRSSFESLQRGDGAVVLVAFDLLELDGVPLVGLPLVERRRRLEEVVDPSAGPAVISPVFDDGVALLQAARDRGLEGIVAKRADSIYRSGRRSPDWVKVKVSQNVRLPVVGWAAGTGRLASSVGALHLGAPHGEGLRYAGSVGSGLSDDEREQLVERLRPLERRTSPLVEEPRLARAARDRIRWVEPALEVDVSFTEWTRAGRLRQPVYRGLSEPRDPAAPTQVVTRLPVPSELRRGRRVLRLSNLDKPFWPEEGITKGDLLAYYRDVAPVLVPHLRRRPFTMKRYPDGWQGKHFFQKQAPSHMPDWIQRAPLPASTRAGERRVIEYPLLDDELALLWAVSMGCIDLHAGAARVDRPERPDWVVFDLDPADGTPFDAVVEVALLVRDVLGAIGLHGVPKTSGSRGHARPRADRAKACPRRRARVRGDRLRRPRALPPASRDDRVDEGEAPRRPHRRQPERSGPDDGDGLLGSPTTGRLGVDPLDWDEVRSELDPAAFTMDAVLTRVAERGDLLAPALAGGQSLTAALRSVG